MTAIMLQTIPSFYTNFSEKIHFISSNTYEKHIVCKKYCIAHHNDKSCSLPACKNHIILLGNVEELLKKLDTYCFTYQHVGCLFPLFKYRFSGKVIAKSGQVFDNVQRAVDFNQGTREWTECRALQKKEALKEKVQQAFVQLLSKDKNNADQWFSVYRKI